MEGVAERQHGAVDVRQGHRGTVAVQRPGKVAFGNYGMVCTGGATP